MQIRTLGGELSVSAMGFGAMGLSEFYGEAKDAHSLEVLKTGIDTGANMIDTANVYGRGHNERLIGHFLPTLKSAQREQIKIATKCGIDRPVDATYERSINNQPDYIRQCCHESLQRLGVERIDLYYLHRVNPDASIEESMSCLSKLVKEGKIAQGGCVRFRRPRSKKLIVFTRSLRCKPSIPSGRVILNRTSCRWPSNWGLAWCPIRRWDEVP